MALDTMRAVAQLGQAYNVSVIDIPVPNILNATDVIVRLNLSAICGSDLHTYHTPVGSSEQPYLYGHEGLGYVTEVGDAVQFLNVGDYVIIPDNLDNGHFTSEPDSYFPPLGFGGLQDGGTLPGLQTEYARVPFADNSLIPIPANHETNLTTLLDYLFISDIFSTAWSGVTFSGFQPGDTVAVFGAGPVGLLAAYSAVLRGASRVYSVDHVQDRLDLAESIGAIPINFHASDPVEQILAREPKGVRRGVEAVGYEAENADGEVDPSTTLHSLVDVVARKGGIGIVGLFDSTLSNFSIGTAYEKAIAIDGGIVLPLQVASELVPLVTTGKARPSFIVSSVIGIDDAHEYYRLFDRREESKVVIKL
ncbi:alcohol dehydrogenase protein [Colletotrichum incanum]|uniref:Alcohol dehydrogenase protein n=1 Tax=Colletotrichum incanum TaxID=1573173 RepID=A0A166LYR1_COLIC|nr:alcohol dehydrogenase protein [Colletotrichum incanum]OHW98693.1 alcohol dehydrogenase protein [Colletotrichum incanum]